MTALLCSPITTLVLGAIVVAGAAALTARVWRAPATHQREPGELATVVRLYPRDRKAPPPRVVGVEYREMPFDWAEDLGPEDWT